MANTVTKIIPAGLAIILDSAFSGRILKIEGFHIGSSSGFVPDPNAVEVVPYSIYNGTGDEVILGYDQDGNTTYNITLGNNVGNFGVGNVMLYVSNDLHPTPQPLAFIVFPTTFPKTVGTDDNVPGNYVVIKVLQWIISPDEASLEVTVNISDVEFGVLPSAAIDTALPSPGPGVMQHWLLHSHTLVDSPVLVMRRTTDNLWWGNAQFQPLESHEFGSFSGGQYGDGYQPKFVPEIYCGTMFSVSAEDIYGGTFTGADTTYTDIISAGRLDQ